MLEGGSCSGVEENYVNIKKHIRVMVMLMTVLVESKNFGNSRSREKK